MDESLTTQSDSRDKEKGWSITQLVGNAPFRGLRETIFKKKKTLKENSRELFYDLLSPVGETLGIT